MIRSVVVGIATIAAWAIAQLIYTVALCPPHRAWERVRSGRSAVVVGVSERVARPGESIFVCETVHSTGPIEWHRDLNCYCAPADAGAAAVSSAVEGNCTLDKAIPSRADLWGACQRASCSHRIAF